MVNLTTNTSYIKVILLIFLIGTLGSGCNTSTNDSTSDNVDSTTTTANSSNKDKIRQKVLFSPVYTIDKKYKSMKGPWSNSQFTLGYSANEPVPVGESINEEIYWIVGMKAEVLNGDGTEVLSDEFMCHVNLDFTSQRQKDMFRHRSRGAHNRLVTLSQGITEINMPDGFGIPMLSTTPIDLGTMVLNHNKTENLPVKVRQRVTIDYIKNSDLDEPLTPLYRQKGAYSMVSMTGQPAIFGVMEPQDVHHDSTCLPGEAAGPDQYTDQFGRRFAAHWVVKPGEDVTHTVITEKMGLPHDTDIHAIGVHLHPFAESITLRDMTTGEVVYESRPKLKEDVIGIEHVPYYSDQKPIPMYKNHDYEIVSVYNNTSSEDQDAMAVFGIYTVDHDFNPVPSLVD